MNIEIRKVNQNDKKAFVELSLALTKFNKRQHDKHYSNILKLLEVKRRRVEETFDTMKQNPHKLIIMAFCDGVPVGYLRAFIYDKKLRQGCLDEFFLREEARGQGIGKKLLAAATQWMKEQNAARMIVSVYVWNTRARAFYEQEGFAEYSLSYEKTIP